MEPAGALVLHCPGCGARLEIARDLTRFACGSCGLGLVAVRRGGTVALVLEEPSPAAVEPALLRLPEELATSRQRLEEKARTLQYLRHHLNDEPGGFELRTIHGVWPALWKSALGTGVLVLAVLADRRQGLPLRGLALSVVVPFALGFGIRFLRNRRAAGHNARVARARQEAIRRNQQEVQKRILALQREHDELARQVAALDQQVALARARAGT